MTVVYGHETSIDEEMFKTFNGNVTGGTVNNSGDEETLTLSCPTDSATFDPHKFGVRIAVIRVDKYRTGSGTVSHTVIQYRTGDTKITCLEDTWKVYNGINFNSLGWIQIRVNKGI